MDGFPLYWVQKLGLKKPRCLEDLTPPDREVCEFLSSLGVVFSTAELIKLEYIPKVLKAYIRTCFPLFLLMCCSLLVSFFDLLIIFLSSYASLPSYASMVLNAEKRRKLAEVALQRKAAPDPSVADASAPVASAPAPVDHRHNRVAEATASEDEDTFLGLVFKRKRKADVAVPAASYSDDRAPSFRENPPSASSPRDLVVPKGGRESAFGGQSRHASY